MDVSALRERVAQSRLLTLQEKAYWTERLPRMNPEQIAKLERILTEAAAIPWNEQVEQYMKVISSGFSPLS